MTDFAFLTGGSRGIGRAVRQRLVAQGLQVVAPTRSELDLSDESSVLDYLNELPVQFQPKVIVLSAAENRPQTISKLTVEQWRRTLEVNLSANFILLQHFCRQARDQAGCKIVALSSAYSARSRQGRTAYAASKAGLVSLIRSVAVEYAEFGILANCVSPGIVDTDLTRANNSSAQIDELAQRIPKKRLATVDEVSRLVSFLVSDQNTYITGQDVLIDGGFTSAG